MPEFDKAHVAALTVALASAWEAGKKIIEGGWDPYLCR